MTPNRRLPKLTDLDYTEDAGTFDSNVYFDEGRMILHNDIRMDITAIIEHAFKAGRNTNESFEDYFVRVQAQMAGMG